MYNKRSSSFFSDWENLPKHLLDSVAEKLVHTSDYLSFAVVCKSWYSVTKDNKSKHAKTTAPVLLIYSGKEKYWKFYDITTKKVINMQIEVPNKPRVVGSSKGWLICVEKAVKNKAIGVTLVNPFLRVAKKTEKSWLVNSRLITTDYELTDHQNMTCRFINLPPFTPPDWEKWYEDSLLARFVVKATLSADPISDAENCVVTVTHVERRTRAFVRLSKDTTWTYVDESVDYENCHAIAEVVNIGSRFYAVNNYGQLLSFNFTDSKTRLVHSVGHGNCRGFHHLEKYVFEGEDGKLLVSGLLLPGWIIPPTLCFQHY